MDDDKRNDWKKYPPRRQRRSTPWGWRMMARKLLASEPRCRTCGGKATEVDHVKPKCLGGSDDPSNAAPICRKCHLKKTAQEANHMRWKVHRVPHHKSKEKAQ